MQHSFRRSVLSAWLAGLLAPVLIAQAQERLPLIDAHNHLVPGMAAENIVGLMDQAGIQKTMLMGNRIPPNRPLGWEDELVLSAHARFPQRLIPFLTTVRRGGVPLQEYARYVEYAESQLKTGRFKGMGEFMVKHFAIAGGSNTAAPERSEPADSPYMQAMMRLGAQYGVPLVFHMETTPDSLAALDRALTAKPTTKVIWAHQNPLKMGGSAEASSARKGDPVQVAQLLDKHPNLYADISIGYATMFIRPQDRTLPARWKVLYESHSDRFVVGLDLAVNLMWEKGYLPRTQMLRGWLSPCPATSPVAWPTKISNASCQIGLDGGTMTGSFVEVGAPTDDDLSALLQTLITRQMKLLTRRAGAGRSSSAFSRSVRRTA